MYRKLFTDKDLFSTIEDKWNVREYVSERVGDDILKEVYHVTDDPGSIPFDSLPDEFVIKPTHTSGSVILVEENEQLDRESIKAQCREWLDTTYGSIKGEYWYEDVKPQILIEERLRGKDSDIPRDFKLFVFHGRVEYIEVDFDRHSNHTRRFYDRNWEPQDFTLRYPLGPELDKPNQLNEMIDIAETLGEDFEFIRVDLYRTSGRDIAFGELTITPESGGGRFVPRKYDFEFGSLW
jgi:hypothetical protein